ncbi:MAG TPA: MIP/aquaporin family protein [Ktedonobacterales bacterium]|nr:MIP/aquaporin family protein [Ktedonobacterales bacterium]
MNRSTAKSIYSGLSGELMAEFLGTLVLVLFGDGCVATFLLFSNNVFPATLSNVKGAVTPGGFFPVDWNLVAFGWGFAVMLGIYVAGAVSGAHINPAVTLAFAARGKCPWSKVVPYWIAQVFGAFLAALLLYLVYRGALYHALNGHNITTLGGVFYTAPRAFVGIGGAFGDEFIGTALLVGLIFALVDLRNQPVQANLSPLVIGLIVVAIGFSFGGNTGYAINPARDFGPRLLVTAVGGGTLAWPADYWWIPIVAPLAGGVFGAFIYDFTIRKVLEVKGAGVSGEARVDGRAVREERTEEHPEPSRS